MSRSPKLSTAAARIPPGAFGELAKSIAARTDRGGDLIGLHIGDTHVSSGIVDAGALDSDSMRYGMISGMSSLKDRVAERAKRERGISFATAHRVHIGVGGTHSLFCAARATLDAGDEVIVLSPYWPLAPGVFASVGAIPVEVPATQLMYGGEVDDLRERILGAVTEKTRAIYFISPNNPDGKVFSEAALRTIAEVAEIRDLWIFADEVYADFTYTTPHLSMGALSGVEERTILVYSFSKSHGIAGARVGYLIAPPEVLQQIDRISMHTVFNVPVVSQRIAIAAIDNERAWQLRAKAVYATARDLTTRMLRDAGLSFFEPEGGTYHFIDFSNVLRGRPLAELLGRAAENGVLLTPGNAFGTYPTHARLCFTAVSEAKLAEGIERLLAAVKSL